MIDRTAIGILGGSFNPPHAGHKALVMHAKRRLRLERVRVLVSPQNPLKPKGDYAPLDERIAATKKVMHGLPTVSVEPEAEQGPVFAIETVSQLLSREHREAFVYIMGADSFANLHLWAEWRQIVESIPIAVIARPGYRMAALRSRAGRLYEDARLPEQFAATLVKKQAPCWCYISGLSMPISSTELRDHRNPLLT